MILEGKNSGNDQYLSCAKQNALKINKQIKTTPTPEKKNLKELQGTAEVFSSRFNKTGSNKVYPNQNMISELVGIYLEDEYC